MLALLPIIALTACTNDDNKYEVSDGFVAVNEQLWLVEHRKPYPFTSDGEISCGIGRFGREVYFNPVGFTDEQHVGTPINKAAADSLKTDGMSPNVPYRVKDKADLGEALELGLRVCGD